MIFLPDVNVWIALTSDLHTHHANAANWLAETGAETIAFCRVTEMGFLRLLTNRHVMGRDVLTPAQAWEIYDAWRADSRVIFLQESAGFSEDWRRLGRKITGGSNAWTDAYLAAFAASYSANAVTFDLSFGSYGVAKVITLP